MNIKYKKAKKKKRIYGCPWIFWVFTIIKMNIIYLISHFQNSFLRDYQLDEHIVFRKINDTEAAISILHNAN